MLIKKRKGKISKRGLYLQDSELKETEFKPGDHYSYQIDTKNRKIMIVKSEEGNKVSKRAVKNGEKPVLDIRKKEAIELFKACQHLEIEIHQDKIYITGINENGEEILKTRITEQKWLDFLHQSKKLSEIPLKVVSLFSGAGLLDYAFIQEGFSIIYAIDYEKGAVETYKENIGDHIRYQDITRVKKEELPHSPIIIGGPDCKAFSNANRTKRLLNHPQNKMIKEYIECVKANKACQVFMMENVPPLLKAGNGTFINEIESELKAFSITKKILNAADYGSAQARKRAIVIGSRIGRILHPAIQRVKYMYKTVRQAFHGLEKEVANQMDRTNHNEETIKRYDYVKQGSNWKDIPESVRPKVSHHNAYRRLHPERPSITLTNYRKSQIIHPFENRTLSVREAARLFDLPDDYHFKGGLSSKQQQLSNGVPISLGRAIAKEIKRAIDEYNELVYGLNRLASLI